MAGTNTINVLMTGAGAPGAAGIIRCLTADPTINLWVADANPNAVGKHLHNQFFTLPKATAPDFIDVITHKCEELGINIIIPLVTRELFPFSKHKADLAQKGIKVLVSDEQALNIANDKGKLYQFLDEAGIITPAYRIIKEISKIHLAIEELGYPNHPVTIKPCISNGSRGFRILDANVNEFDLFFNEKPTGIYITPEKLKQVLSGHKLPNMIVSEYLPGDEYSVDCLAKNGETLLCLPRVRRKMVGGISTEGEFIRDESIVSYCKQIIKAIGLHGNIGIQVKQAKDGTYKILEINPRVQGTIVAALGAGVNLPLLAIQAELGQPVTTTQNDVKWGTKFSRFWDEVFY